MEGHFPYLAQEYVAAESLDVAMKHYAPAVPARVMPFLRQIASAIDAAAEGGILHGGLHPRDIFLTTDEARATGFGIVQAIENIGFRAPTRRPYTAPERVSGDEWGVEADVFALGAIAHELLTGRRPAGPADQDGSFSNDVPAEHRARLRDVLSHALAENPAARFVSATAFVDALEAASEGRRVDLPAMPAAAATTAAAGAAAAAAAAPSLFDEPEPAEPADDLDQEPAADVPIETTEEVEDAEDVHDIEDVEDADEVEDAHVIEEPVEPVRDAWPPPGFSTADLDIVTERETDEAATDFDLHLNPSGAVDVEHEPSPAEAEEALHAAEAFEYETSVEADETDPWDAAAHAPSIPPPPAAPPVVTPAVSTAPARPAESWRRSATVVTQPPSASAMSKGMAALLGVAGLALGLLLGWAIFGGDTALAPSPDTTTNTAAPNAPAGTASGTATEVPVPSQPVEQTAPPTPATASTPPPPTSGSVLVRSTPSGAGVVIDGVWSGRTPFTKRGIPFGAHLIRVVLEGGYEPVNQRITLTPENASRELTFELRRRAGARSSQPSTPVRRETARPAGTPAPSAAADASLSISSRPTGARVYVDGRMIGSAPAKLAGLRAGSYHVRVELDGYQTWTTTVHVAAGQDARVAAPLVPVR